MFFYTVIWALIYLKEAASWTSHVLVSRGSSKEKWMGVKVFLCISFIEKVHKVKDERTVESFAVSLKNIDCAKNQNEIKFCDYFGILHFLFCFLPIFKFHYVIFEAFNFSLFFQALYLAIVGGTYYLVVHSTFNYIPGHYMGGYHKYVDNFIAIALSSRSL